MSPVHHIPSSTYRLQFNRQFTFHDAQSILPYLHHLGISHVYASPIMEAPPDSFHGYDVSDPTRVNSTLGGEPAFLAFARQLSRLNLGLIIDFVPNHMGIDAQTAANAWWRDVLQNGPNSSFAPFFDIDWTPRRQVVLPVLGDFFGDALERGEIRLGLDYPPPPPASRSPSSAAAPFPGLFNARYFKQTFPLNDAAVRLILTETASSAPAPLKQILDPLLNQPDLQPRLAAAIHQSPEIQTAIQSALDRINGQPGSPSSFDLLQQILDLQHYRLTYWIFGRDEINYRRFFEIDTLPGLRVEDPIVFSAVHSLLRDFLSRGLISGVRIDHIDGLRDPEAYLHRVRQLASNPSPQTTAQPAPAPAPSSEPFYLIVEKILQHDEQLPASWPVHGTTGYEFAALCAGLLIDPAAAPSLTQTNQDFTGRTQDFSELACEQKRRVIQTSFPRELRALAASLHALAQHHRKYRDLTLSVLESALLEWIACLSRYRTYVNPEQNSIAPQDRRSIHLAAKQARPNLAPRVRFALDFLSDILSLTWPDRLLDSLNAAPDAGRFIRALQQRTGAVMAKAVEDTAFFLYNRLLALNEVGAHPSQFGISLETFHQTNAHRASAAPHTLLATSTHDTKMSEDVRARLAALSEVPNEWAASVTLWRSLNNPWKQRIGDRLAPDPNEEYLLYQALLGSWPLESLPFTTPPPLTPPAPAPAYIQRIQTYFQKTTREAKQQSSWTDPNEAWETAQNQFVACILDPTKSRQFLNSFLPFAKKIAQLGAVNALTQTLLKLTVPGVPDIYQGNEIWDFSLLDPDNRRPVDFARRQQMLGPPFINSGAFRQEEWTTGAIKLFLTQSLLQFRFRARPFFESADYEPLLVRGPHAHRCIAFRRRFNNQSIIVLGCRFTEPLGFFPLGQVWDNTSLEFPEISKVPLRNLFTNEEVSLASGKWPLSSAFKNFPFAVLSDF